MSRVFSGGKRNREAKRDLKKRQKEERLRRNREVGAGGLGPDPDPNAIDPSILAEGAALPEVKLEDVVIGVASRSRRADFGPTKLFVGGLGPSTTAGDLRTFFSRFGELVEAVVVPNRATGRSIGWGRRSLRPARRSVKRTCADRRPSSTGRGRPRTASSARS